MTPFAVTFYSYKGGVGRSLLAANIGVLCARRGKTLLWDLDIEAPGLHHIRGLTPAKPVKLGFFEWLTSWQDSGRAAGEANFSALTKLVCQTPVAEGLFILPAFADDADFAALYQGIRWDDFLVRDLDTGLALFRGILEALGKAGFETVLLDSRTGITDIGGLLAALLPHATVLVGNYGRQNTKGLNHVWKALAPAATGFIAPRGSLPPLTRLLVASPIADDTKLRAAGESIWKETFGLAPSEMVTVPFDPSLLFTEDLYAAERPDSPVAKAYSELEARIENVRSQVLADSESAQRSDAERPDQVIRRGADKLAQGKSFEERTAHLLRLLGYAVEREQLIDGNRVDLVARKRADFGREEVYLVECKDHKAVVPKETLQVFKTSLEGPSARQMQARGMLVAAKDFSAAGRAYAREQGMQALTYDELERSLFDFAPYLARIRQRYEASPLASTYVDQFLALEKQPEAAPTAMLPHALAWAAGAGSRLWLVLGDYGTGKSTLIERLAYQLARNCEDDAASPIPIAINLRQFPNAISLESLIREHLESELRTVLNPEIVLHLLEAGRVVLLLDSFDEMGVAQAGRSVEEQFRQLVRPTASAGRNPRGNRMLITSRSHFFRDSGSARHAVRGGDDLFEPDSPLGKAARAFDATLDTLPVFTPEQINDYLRKRLGTIEGDRARKRIAATYGLREIASTPQLLDMVVASLPDLLKQGGQVTTASLYLTYTNRWLSTFRLSQAEVGVDHMRDLLERMACELWRRPRNQIHYADLANLLRQEQSLARGIDSERVDLELRTAAFLVRSADGHYRFSHRSFLEFFFARALFRALQDGRLTQALTFGRINPDAIDFLLQLITADDSSTQTFDQALRGILAAPYADGVSENALLIAHRAAFQRAKVGLIFMPADGEGPSPALHERLDPHYRALIPVAAQLSGANLAGTSLRFLHAENMDLSGADLSSTDMNGASLPGVRLDGARLDDARLSFANLDRASLVTASALRIDGHQMHLEGANCEQAVFDGADLRGLNATRADFGGARLRLSRLADAILKRAKLSSADLTGSTWPRAEGCSATPGIAPREPRIAGLIGHDGSVNACAFSPDGDRVLTASGGSARLWDVASGKELRRFEGHAGPVNACAFSPHGDRVLTAGNDRSARLWDAASGKELRRFEGHGDSVLACAFSPDGGRLLTAGSDRSARLWDTASGKELRRFAGHGGPVNACAFSPDGGRLLTAGNDGSARLWDAASGKELRRFEGHGDWVRACAFCPDGGRLLTAGDDGSARLWDAASGKELRRFEGHGHWVLACAFSPDGGRLLTAGRDDSVRLWDAASGKELRRFAGHGDWVRACAFSPDGGRLLTAGDDGSARLWDATSGKELRRFEGHDGPVNACAFSPDGGRLITAGSDRSARLWDAASGKELRRFEGHGDSVLACAFSPDGGRLLTAGSDRSARLWDAASGKELRRFEGHGGPVNACAFSPDGGSLLTAGNDGSARLWDTASGKELRRFEGHGDWVRACAFCPDGGRLLTAGDDGSARLWDAASGKELRRFEGHGDSVRACAFSPDGGRVLTAGNGGSTRLWDAASGKEQRVMVSLGDSWLSWCRDEARWDGAGPLTDCLRYEDDGEVPEPVTGWVPRHWLAADLPELRGLTPLIMTPPPVLPPVAPAGKRRMNLRRKPPAA